MSRQAPAGSFASKDAPFSQRMTYTLDEADRHDLGDGRTVPRRRVLERRPGDHVPPSVVTPRPATQLASAALDARRSGSALTGGHHAELLELRPSSVVLLEVRPGLPEGQPRGRSEWAVVAHESRRWSFTTRARVARRGATGEQLARASARWRATRAPARPRTTPRRTGWGCVARRRARARRQSRCSLMLRWPSGAAGAGGSRVPLVRRRAGASDGASRRCPAEYVFKACNAAVAAKSSERRDSRSSSTRRAASRSSAATDAPRSATSRRCCSVRPVLESRAITPMIVRYL